MKLKSDRIFEIIREYDYKTLNYRLILFSIALSVIGILAISSATDDSSLVTKQIAGLVAGVILMLVVALIKYEFLARYYWLMYFASLIILLSVLIFGVERSGAKRWIDFKFIQIQPSEICKILLLIFVATLLVRNRASLNSWKFCCLHSAFLRFHCF